MKTCRGFAARAVFFLVLFCAAAAHGRLVDNGDGTVTDTSTGLMWQQATAPDSYTWADALSYCEGLSLAGQTDWRLPNRKELRSIVDYSRYGPAIDTAYFPDTLELFFYWSSATNADRTAYAWRMNFSGGYGRSNNKSDYFHVRAVRGGQSRSLGHLVILTPVQGGMWAVGSDVEMTWNTAGLGGDARISLSRDGGRTFSVIAETTPNDGAFTWTVDGSTSVNCALKIEPLDDPAKDTTQSLFSITIPGAVTGTVTDAATGLPIAGMRLSAYDGSCGGALMGTVQTDAEGLYAFNGVAPGDIYIRTAGTSSYPPLNYINAWWDGITGASGVCTAVAQPVSVPAGETHSGIDLQLQSTTPDNDNFADAFLLTESSGQAVGNNSDATREAGEPDHVGITGGKSVWWRWVAPFSGGVSFDTVGSSFDTLLAAYTGSSVSALSVIASNDDDDGTQSRILFFAEAGTTYHIAVDGYNGATGSIVLNYAPAEIGSATVTGTVTDAATGLPIAGIQVVAHVCEFHADGCSCTSSKSGVTDSDGKYEISGIAPGDVYIQTDAHWSEPPLYYVDVWWGQTDVGSCGCYDRQAVTVAAGETISGIDFSMQTGGILSGTVTDTESGQPIEGMQICYSNGYCNGTCTWCIYTDSEGNYSTGVLPPGNASVFTEASRSDPPLNFVDLWWDGNLGAFGNCWEVVQVIPINAGEMVSGIDFAMQPGGKVAGTVTDAVTGLPVEGLKLYAYMGSCWAPTNYAVTDASGNYEIIGLASGNVYVSAKSAWSDPPLSYMETWWDGAQGAVVNCWDVVQPVSVAGGETVAGVDFAMQPAATIAGTVTDAETGEPVQGMYLYAYHGACYGTWLGSVQTDAAGHYTFNNVPQGDVYIGTVGNWSHLPIDYVDVWWDGADGAYGSCYGGAKPVSVAAGETVSNIDFALQPGATITGTVIAEDTHAPLVGAYVSARTDPCNGSFLGSGQTDAAGRYHIDGLPQVGVYLVSDAWGYLGAWWDDGTGVPGSCGATAAPVVLAAGQTTSGIDFALPRAGEIMGTVKRSDTQEPIAGLWVYAFTSTCRYGQIAKVMTDANGQFHFGDLEPGDVFLRTYADLNDATRIYENQWYRSGDGIARPCDVVADAVTVTGGASITGIDFYMDQGARVTGTVFGPDGVTPLAGVKVQPYADNCRRKSFRGELTDADGNYELTGIHGGVVFVEAEAPEGYTGQWYDGVVARWGRCGSGATAVATTLGATTSGINFSLQESGAVTGTVTQSDGVTPIEGLWLQAFLDPCSSHPVGAAYTDAAGQYLFPDLAVGAVYLRTYTERIPETAHYDNQWYVGGDAVEAGCTVTASAVPVNPGETTAGIDFRMLEKGAVAGKVTEEDGVTPVVGMWVKAYSDTCRTRMLGEAQTDGAGLYEIAGVPIGGIFLATCAECDGATAVYLDQWWDGGEGMPGPCGETAQALQTDAGETVSGIDFALVQSGRIKGTVTDDPGQPIAGLTIFVTQTLDVAGPAGPCDTQPWLATVETDESGAFQFHKLPPGSYYVGACASCDDLPYVDHYFGGGAECNLAQTVVLAGGDTAEGVDFEMEAGGWVTGTVQDNAGAALAGLHVFAEATGCSGDWLQDTETDAEGRYTLTGLPVGDALVQACGDCGGGLYMPEWYGANGDDCQAATPVAVAAGNYTTGIDFNLDPAGAVYGMVTAEGGGPIAGLQVFAELPGCTGQWLADTETDINGNYTLTGLPLGEVTVKACGNCGEMGYVAQWYGINYDDCGHASLLSLEEGTSLTSIDFNLPMGGEITGRVMDAQENPAAGVLVQAWWDACNHGHLGGTQTDADGYYRLTGIPEGTVAVSARDEDCGRNLAWQWYDAGSYKCGEAGDVSVTAGLTSGGIDFYLDQGGSVSGTLENDAGEPVSGMQIQLSSGTACHWDYVASAFSGADGGYAFCGVPVGVYFLQTSPNCRNVRLNFVREMFGADGMDCNLAEAVSVAAGQQAAGKDFALTAGGSVSGWVTDELGNPISDVPVIVHTPEACNLRNADSGDTGADGRYTVCGIPEGNAYVNARPFASGLNYLAEWYDTDSNDCSLATAVSVEVNQDSPGIDFALAGPGGTVSGTITDDLGQPLDGVDVFVETEDCRYAMGWMRSGPDGRYSVTGLPVGAVKVRACPACSGLNYTEGWWDGKASCEAADSVSVIQGEETGNIDISVAPGGAISGTVTDMQGNPVSGLDVSAFKAGEQGACDADHLKGTRTDADGHYEITVLAGGDYFIKACASCSDPQLNFLDAWHGEEETGCESARAVPVVPGQITGNIDFNLATAGTVSGTVTDRWTGGPLPGVWVEAWAGQCWQRQISGMETGADGGYRLTGLQPGPVYVYAYGKHGGLHYANRWHDNVSEDNCSQAAPVAVVGGEETGGIDFALFLDTDRDNMDDRWEIDRFGSKEARNGNGDWDGDGLNDRGEYEHDTNQQDTDSDNDLFTDGYEAGQGSDPNSSREVPALPVTGSVMHVRSPFGTYSTYIDLTIGPEYLGPLPGSIQSITVTGPGGVSYTKADMTYGSSWRGFSTGFNGAPPIGTYTFTVTTTGGAVGVATDTQSVNRNLPIPDTAAFSPAYMEQVKTPSPIFSWSPVSLPGVALYYRLDIITYESDGASTLIYASERVRDMTSHAVPHGVLEPGKRYYWRVRVTDSGDWVGVQNRSHTHWVPFEMAETLSAQSMPAIDLNDYGVVKRTTEWGKFLSIHVRVIDHDGITADGSSHEVTVRFPDGGVHRLDEYSPEGPTSGFYGLWVDLRDWGAPEPGTGDYIFTVTDPDGNQVSVTDELVEVPIEPVDPASISPSMRNPVEHRIQGTIDNVTVNDELFYDFNRGVLDLAVWQQPRCGTLELANQQVEVSRADKVGTSNCNLEFNDPASINSVGAQITVDPSSTDAPDIRIQGTWYSNGTNDVWAAVNVHKDQVTYWVIELKKSGGETMLDYRVRETLKAVTPGETVNVAISWDEVNHRFTFTADDVTAHFDPTDAAYQTPITAQKSIGAQTWLTTEDTTPTFVWDPVTNALRYFVEIRDFENQRMWNGHTDAGQSTYTVPPGVLQPDSIYRFTVETMDAHSGFENDNTSRTPGWSDDAFVFFTGDLDPKPFIEWDSHGVYTQTGYGRATFLSFWVKVHDAQGVPGDIASVTVTDPSGVVYLLDYQTDWDTTPTSGYYWGTGGESLPAGEYTFTVLDHAGNRHTTQEVLDPNPLAAPDLSTLSPVNHTVLSDTAVAFDWEDIPGAAFYRVEIYDADGERIYKFHTTESRYDLAAGFLKRQTLYSWRVVVYREFFDDNVDNRSQTPADRSEALNFWTGAVTGGAYDPVLTLDKRGAEVTCLDPTGSGDFSCELSFWALVWDPDGVPGNIESVTVTYPDGTTVQDLGFDRQVSGIEAAYSWRQANHTLAEIPCGEYRFKVTDVDGGFMERSDTLACTETNELAAPPGSPENLTPADGDTVPEGTRPGIGWDEVAGATGYRVKIYDDQCEPIHDSGLLDRNFYRVPDGVLALDATYSYRVYVYGDEPGNNSDTDPFYAEDTDLMTLSNWDCVQGPYFTTAAVNPGDVNGDGVIDMQDAVLALQAAVGIGTDLLAIEADVNGDGRIGVAEALYVLGYLAGLR